MDKLVVLPDQPVLHIGDRLTLDFRDADHLRSALAGPLFVTSRDTCRHVAGLDFLGLPCHLSLNAASVFVSFDDYANPDSVMSLPQVKRFIKRHPELPHTVHGLAQVDFSCPEGSWRKLSFSHDKKNDHTSFRAQF
ncbi:MAG: hypothetical protein Q4D96_02980 [Propionibacteriaceae bacterium]|nr:hypothetical protein [Propionibacteriaceae bacterium]